MATTLPEHPGLSALIDKVSAKRNGDDLWYVELVRTGPTTQSLAPLPSL